MITTPDRAGHTRTRRCVLDPFLIALFYSSALVCSGQTFTGGLSFSTAICSDGQLVGWGRQMGNMITTTSVPTPLNPIFTFDGITAVSSGIYHSVVLRNDGKVFTYGDNSEGQLGVGSSISHSNDPLEVPGLTDVIGISAALYGTLVLLGDGTVRFWGHASDASIIFTPVAVNGLTDIVQVAAGRYAQMALRADGTVWTWGYGELGQLGQGDQITESQAPVQILTDISGIAASANHMMAIRANGELYIWGDNIDQGSGTGVGLDILWYPESVLTVDDTDPCGVLCEVKAAQTGRYVHAAIVGDNGRVVFWGSTYGPFLGSQRPVRLFREDGSELTGAKSLSRGYEHMLVELENGQLLAFGSNTLGELGTGDQVSSDHARQVINLCPLLVVGTEEQPTRVAATLYPNPCSEWLTVKVPGAFRANIEVLDVLGQVIMRGSTNLGSGVLNTGGLRGGVYLLKGRTTAGMVFSERFVKE